MSGFHSEIVRLPASRSADGPRPAPDRGEEPVVLRFPSRSRAAEVTESPGRPVRPLWIRGYRGKRSFDVAVGALLSLVLAPLALLIVSIVALFGRGRVLDREEVVGNDGQPFLRLRFRTRAVLRSVLRSGRTGEGDEAGEVLPLFDALSVPRTRLGRFLHATGLERLPELWNVLRGDLALVGPSARSSNEAESTDQFPPRWDLKPGFVWVAAGEPEHEAVMRYVATQGMWTDVRILAASTWRLAAGAIKSSRAT